MKKIEILSNKQMKSVNGGRRREVDYKDVNGDGRIDKVIEIYDKAGNLIRTTIKYG